MRLFANYNYFKGFLLLFCCFFTFSETFSQKKANPVIRKKQKFKRMTTPNIEKVFQSGEVYVRVRSVADRTIRLGLAPGGVTIVEFPIDDFIFARHPGDENIVTIDEMIKVRANPSDPLIFRPGQGFQVPNKSKQIPYSQITVQMVSGAVFTFQIYPVTDLQKSATRVEVLYSVQDIVSERRKLNLPTNLNISRQIKEPETEKEGLFNQVSETENEARSNQATPQIDETITEIQAMEVNPGKKETEADRITDFSQKVIGEAPKYKWKFGTPTHGLALAAQKTLLLENAKYRLDLIAVKNTLNEPLRLVNLPNLVIETFERERGKGSALNQEMFPVFSLIHNLPSDFLIQPNSVCYFAVVAKYPVILGLKQELKISVAQTNAADSPAFLSLLTTAR